MQCARITGDMADEKRTVFHVSELEKLGVSQSTSYRRARADGPWTRLAPGIILTRPGPPTPDDLIDAALLRAGPTGMITGIHGARLHGTKAPAGEFPIHVLIPHSRKLQNQPAIRFERTTRLPDPVFTKDGVPLAPLTRATLDGARTWQTRDITESLLIEAIQRGHGCHPAQLRTEMELGSRRGTGLPREILRSITVDVRSVPELRAHRLLRRSGLPDPEWNVRIFDSSGRYVGCPDIWFDDVGLAVEIDSYEFHFSKQSYAATTLRNTRYAMNGIVVLPVLPARLKNDPEGLVADIRSAYRTAAERGRPEVIVDRNENC